MKATNRIACLIIVMLGFVYRASSIHCYYCNSANNSACIDLNAFDDETRSRIIPVVNCETAIPSPVAADFFCRKIIQTIYHTDKESEIRVTRGCGWVRHHHNCYRADNRDHLETVCQCFSDHCNSADSPDPTAMTWIFLTFSAVLYFLR